MLIFIDFNINILLLMRNIIKIKIFINSINNLFIMEKKNQ